VGRPNRAGLGFQRDGLGVGDAIAELGTLAATDGARIGVKILDGQVFAAELLEGQAVCFALPAGFFFGGAVLDYAIIVPAGKKCQADEEGDDDENGTGIKKRILENGFRFVGSRLKGHEFWVRDGTREIDARQGKEMSARKKKESLDMKKIVAQTKAAVHLWKSGPCLDSTGIGK
jgi:hypothetical protein